jgi:hypothetical protein
MKRTPRHGEEAATQTAEPAASSWSRAEIALLGGADPYGERLTLPG